MTRTFLRILQVVLVPVGGLLVVPIGVNVVTGGEPATWLRPFTPWLWPLSLGFVVAIAVLEAVIHWLDSRSPRFPHRLDHPDNVGLALDQVSKYVESRRGGLLTQRIRLQFDERASAVLQPMHLVRRVSDAESRLPADCDIASIFVLMSEAMLILGAPGAGKTTQLLDLAAALIERARAAEPARAGIPVVFDLADWPASGGSRVGRLLGSLRPGRPDGTPRDLTDWLISGLASRYGIPGALAQEWLRTQRFIVLLDGLDEVHPDYRDRAVEELNLAQTRGLTRLAVCSRERDYDVLKSRLRLQGAVAIRPISRDEVATFLTRMNPRLAESFEATLAQSQDSMWDAISTPLMLGVFLAAAQDARWERFVRPGGHFLLQPRLLDAYVVEVLARRRGAEIVDPLRFVRGLKALALSSRRFFYTAKVTTPMLSDEGLPDLVQETGRQMFAFACLVASLALASAMTFYAGWTAGIASALGLGYVVWKSTPDDLSVLRLIADKKPVIYCLLLTCALLWGGLTGALLIAHNAPEFCRWLIVAGLLGLACLLLANIEDYLLTGGIPAVPLLAAAAVAWFGLSQSGAEGAALGFLIAPVLVLGGLDSVGRKVTAMRMLAVLAVAASPALLVRESAVVEWQAVGGWLAGALLGFLPGIVFWIMVVDPMALWTAFAAAGVSDPNRRSFLRLAVDKGLLLEREPGIKNHREPWHWIHRVVLEHLATCSPESLAADVHRRRAELDADQNLPLP